MGVGFCGAVPAEMGYTVHNVTSEVPGPGDCLVVTTAGFEQELALVQGIRNFTYSALLPEHAGCKRVRFLVFCKAFRAPECNVTFDRNFGLECAAILVAAGDDLLRPLVTDALISAPARTVVACYNINITVDNERACAVTRRTRLQKILEAVSVPGAPPYLSFPAFPLLVGYEPNFTIDSWKGAIDKAHPRPLSRWVLTHFPNASAELARRRHFDSEHTQGVFAASGEAVLRHPPDAYLRLLLTQNGKKPESCHYLERMWRYLFF